MFQRIGIATEQDGVGVMPYSPAQNLAASSNRLGVSCSSARRQICQASSSGEGGRVGSWGGVSGVSAIFDCFTAFFVAFFCLFSLSFPQGIYPSRASSHHPKNVCWVDSLRE